MHAKHIAHASVVLCTTTDFTLITATIPTVKQLFKRIGTDAAGYGLILLGVALGWLPGPGGIPLVVAGLGLLSINNAWAKRLRLYLLTHGGRMVQMAFPAIAVIQWLYDCLVLILLVLVAFLGWRHAAIWQLSLAIALFFIAFFVLLMNRDRLNRLKLTSKR
jgi:hypothetical protein